MAHPRRNDFLIPTLGVLFDSLAIASSFLLAYLLRFRTPFLHFLPLVEGVPPLAEYLRGAAVIIPIWLLIFNSRKMYGARRNVARADDFLSIIRLVTLGMLVVMSAAFFYRAFSYSRAVFGLLWILSIVFIFTGRLCLYWIERWQYRRGKDLRHAVIIGHNATANRIFYHLHDHPLLGFKFIGYFSDTECLRIEPLGKATWLGRMDDIPNQLLKHRIEMVLVALDIPEHEKLVSIIQDCEGMNVEFMIVPDFVEIMTSRMAVKEIEGIPFVRLKGVPMTTWGRIAKRLFDFLISSVLLIVTSPLFLLIGLLIKLTSHGEAMFVQERIGLDGKPFKILKFRSMKRGSEQFDRYAGLGIQNDPRQTFVGRILRRTSLDELPQLINVWKGEMSLVGPRPERPYFVEQFKRMIPKYLDRHRVKTGITGWAQVNGLRGDSSLEERIKFDIYYIENWSMLFDLKIILRTVRALF
ncbi:MAG TPA: undecaprenyl-phosphate glucose phosphotransferase [Bacteroidota bacterium]|nr:undecaprenyl-phosphate glucose phosphotransferase [Bacteroidota bacterium]